MRGHLMADWEIFVGIERFDGHFEFQRTDAFIDLSFEKNTTHISLIIDKISITILFDILFQFSKTNKMNFI